MTMKPEASINANAVASEWLETDGCGGFASGTISGIRTRRYHALLLAATVPPTGRMVLVNGFDAWIETPAGKFALSSQSYSPDIVHPDGAQRIEDFSDEPWPMWIYRFEDGTVLAQELFVSRNARVTAITWRLLKPRKDVKLIVRPFLSGRDYHGLHTENTAFRFDAVLNGEKVLWRPYEGIPGIYAMYSHNGGYSHEPLWYRNFLYQEEHARGLDCNEDLASPGIFGWDLSASEAVWLLATTDSPALAIKGDDSIMSFSKFLRESELLRRKEFPTRLHRAADDYLVAGHSGKTIIAGYPWFTDWGRDSFVALRGLCLATGKIAEAREILLSWTSAVSEGMLPNRFPDRGGQAEYNSVDASLWFVVAVYELLQACAEHKGILCPADRKKLQDAVEVVIGGYSKGTRYGIRMAGDGLLASGERGVQLTWMDAKVGDWVVTPRVGKAVEVQALWLNALKIASQFSTGWKRHFDRGLKSFQEKFWNKERGSLFDVIDANHNADENDASLRPNQIFAVGGLPFQLITGERARKIVAVVERELLTPLGLRSLAPGEPNYHPHYEGGVWQRDAAYHQGTVWPWLMGPFVEAWLRVHDNIATAKHQARQRFLKPLLAHLEEAGIAHVSEIADAEAPHQPRGCPFQAWSVGELLRLEHLLAPQPKGARKSPGELMTA
jgi:predicted glycogen debranching enzyme